MKFNQLEIIQPILKAIDDMGYEQPTPIQLQTIPYALKSHDILGCAQTGTGKTAAFAIPILQHLNQQKHKGIKALILTPTRELATQIEENIIAYGKYMDIKSTVIFGGVSQRGQEKAIRAGADIVVATPGRLNDLIKQKLIDLHKIECFVLDEADRMLDMGFLNDVKKIIKELPTQKQTMFFSATMPNDIKELANTLLQKPKYIEVSPVSSTVDTVSQMIYYVDKPNKKRLLVDLIKEADMRSVLVFTRTKNNANRLAKYLIGEGVESSVIHGNKSQNARQCALANFKDGKSQVLVATDIAARGIDINELSYVVNYDLPNEPESYVHRIGRTGRAGNSGISLSFCDVDELEYVKSIERLIHKKLPVNRTHNYPMLNLEPSPKQVRGRGKRDDAKKPVKKVQEEKKRSKRSFADTKKTQDRKKTHRREQHSEFRHSVK